MGPKRKSMEDEEEGKNKTNATDSAVKRPRMLTKRFTFNEAFIEGTSTGSRKRTSIGSTKELLYSPDTIIAVRAEKDTFYLCETVRNVYNTSGKFNIRWLEVEEAPYKYRRAYNDNIRLECVLTSVKMSKVPKEKKCFMISKEEIARIQKLLKASVTGQDVLSLDKDLFEPVSKKSRAVADADKDDDTDTEVSGPSKKTKKTPPSKQKSAKHVPNNTKKNAAAGGRKQSVAKQASLKKKPSLSSAPTLKRGESLKKAGSLTRASSSVKNGLPQKKTSLLKKNSMQRTLSQKSLKKAVSIKTGGNKRAKLAIVARKRNPNKKLKVNENVTVWEKDPLFESKEDVIFVSPEAHSRLLIRAVRLNDMELLKSCIADIKQVGPMTTSQSLHNGNTAMDYAILAENEKAIKILMAKRLGFAAQQPASLLQYEGTGRYNPRSLGIKKIRKVQMSRGGKEGNNALAKNVSTSANNQEYIVLGLTHGVKAKTLQFILAETVANQLSAPQSHFLHHNIHVAIRAGHGKLAAELIEDAAKSFGDLGFNNYHIEALKLDKEDWKGTIRETSAKKKCLEENKHITPIHCAAINPEPKFLSKLLAVCPDINIVDHEQKRPIHYAAACTKPGPLELLISRGASVDEMDKEQLTPLFIACKCGRAENVRVILEKNEEQNKQMEAELAAKMRKKHGVGGVNKHSKHGWLPIHMAVMSKDEDTVAMVLEFGADINKPATASPKRITALILAASMGNLDMVKYLIDEGAKIEKEDKMKRTALVHAAREGNANVASYLLHRGANPNAADSSGNTAMHYAAAYGNYFCIKALLAASANPDPANDWKLTPLAVSYMKGHQGLTEMLMDIPGVNINFQDEKGRTMIMCALNTHIYTQSTFDYIQLLVVKKAANVNLHDNEGKSVLHYLASKRLQPLAAANVKAKTMKKARSDELKIIMDLAALFIDHGCELNFDEEKPKSQSLLTLVISQQDGVQNLELLKYLISRGLKMDAGFDPKTSNATVLSILVGKMLEASTRQILDIVSTATAGDRTGADVLKEMAQIRDHTGATPLMQACGAYGMWNRPAEDLQQTLHNRAVDMFKYLLTDLGSAIEYHHTVTTGEGDEKKEVTTHFSALHKVITMAINTDRKHKLCKLIMEHKPDVDFYDNSGKTILMVLADGHPNTAVSDVQYIINAGASVNLRSTGDEAKFTPLLYAVQKGNTDITAKLLENGADVNAVDEKHKESPLYKVVRTQDVSMLKLLIKHKADVNLSNITGLTPLHEAALKVTDNPDAPKDIEKILIRNGADMFAKDQAGSIPLHYMFQHSSKGDPVESYTIFASAMKYQRLDEKDNVGNTPLHKAAKHGATVCCMLLIQKGCEINRPDCIGNNPLAIAVRETQESCVLTLMQKGADVSSNIIINPDADVPPKETEEKQEEKKEEFRKDHYGRKWKVVKRKSAWKYLSRHWPAPWKPGSKGHPIFQGIVSRGWQGLTFLAMDLLEPFGMQYASAVEIALRLRKYRFGMGLMEKQMDTSKLQALNENKQTLLHALAEYSQFSDWDIQKQIIEELLNERGIPLNAQDSKGFTALHYALRNRNHVLAIHFLQTDGIIVTHTDVHKRNCFGALFWDYLNEGVKTPFTSNDMTRTVGWLCDKGAVVDTLMDFPPVDRVQGGWIANESKQAYLTHNTYNISPLIAAVAHKDHALVIELLQRHPETVNFPDEAGLTPLMYAVMLNDVLMVRLLLGAPLDINPHKLEEIIKNAQDSVICRKKKPPKPCDKEIITNLLLPPKKKKVPTATLR